MGARLHQRWGSRRCQPRGCGRPQAHLPSHPVLEAFGGVRRQGPAGRAEPTGRLWGPPGSCSLPPAPPSCSRTASCLAASVPSLASWPPQPWVLGAGQGLPAVSFLPFLGRKPGWWGAPGWSLSRGGGLSHHPVPQSDSAPCPHPSLGSLGHSGRWINGVAAHAGPRAQATPAGRPARRICPDSHGPLWERRSICPGPGNPSTEPVSGSCAGQAGWGAGWAVRSSAPSLGLWHPGLAEGTLGTLV